MTGPQMSDILTHCLRRASVRLNMEFSHIAQCVSTDAKYHHVKLAHNYIEDLTLKNILVLDTFGEVDLRNNPLNCTNSYLYNRGYILSDCHFLTFTSTSKSTILGNSTSEYETTSHIKNGNVPGLVVLVTCTLLCKLHSKHCVIQAKAMELNVLRSFDESDEEGITLFNSKEKQF